VKLELPMSKSVVSCNLTATQGKYSFDPVTRVLMWDVGRIDPSRLPNIRGNVSALLVLESQTNIKFIFWHSYHTKIHSNAKFDFVLIHLWYFHKCFDFNLINFVQVHRTDEFVNVHRALYSSSDFNFSSE
jgi:hypothetical protein